MKDFDTNKSNSAMKAVRVTEAPFTESPDGAQVDYQKLAQLWAATQEALQAVGEGFVNVVEATSETVEESRRNREDNLKTREDARHTRRVVQLGAVFAIVGGSVLIGMIYFLAAATVRDVRHIVLVQRDEIQKLKELSEELRKDARVSSSLQTKAIAAQVATQGAEMNATPETVQKAEIAVIEAQVEVAKSRVALAEEPGERREAEQELKQVQAKSRIVGPALWEAK